MPNAAAPTDASLAHDRLVRLSDEDRRLAVGQLAWIGPSVLMLVLGLIRVTWPAFWADELATWGMATVDWGQFFGVLGKMDAVVGPYYLFIRTWAEFFGASEFALRLPSVFAMTAAVAVTSQLGSRMGGPRVGILSGFLMALLPTSSRFAQEARPYAFAVLAAALATLALMRLLDEPTRRRLVLYAASVALLGLMHNVALTLLAAHGLVVLAVRRDLLRRWLIAAGAGVAVVLPLLILGSRQSAQIGWIPEPSWEQVAKLPEGVFGTPVVGGAVVALFLIGFSFRQPALLPTLWAVVPVLAVYLASLLEPLLLPRYLLFTVPAWAVLAAMALGRGPLIRGIAALAVLGALGLPSQEGLRTQSGHGQGSRDVGALLFSYAEPGDAVIYGRTESRAGRDILLRYLAAAQRPEDPLLLQPARTAGNFLPVECEEIEACFGSPARVWVIRVGSFDNPLAQLGKSKEDFLASRYSIQTVWRPTGLTVALLIKQLEE